LGELACRRVERGLTACVCSRMSAIRLKYIPVSDADPKESKIQYATYTIDGANKVQMQGVQAWIALQYSVEEFFEADINLLVVEVLDTPE